MKLIAKEIELFENLSQFHLGYAYYDFHNDFDCIKIALESNCLLFIFKKSIEEIFISFKFENVDLVRFEFENFHEFESLTIDNIYRARFEKDGQLIEFNNDSKSYFYVEFVEDIRIELWCESIIVGNG